MKQKITIFDIANWFLSRESMTHKKLQKLCYYAQAWYCALYDGTPLFNEEIQAWIHGPVCPVLWNEYHTYKWNDIPKLDNTLEFNSKVLKVLTAVYDNYRDMSGADLEALTQSEEPWINARGNLAPYESGTNIITTNSMAKYYLKIYEDEQND